MARLTHTDARGRARMVDVGRKAVSRRRAWAEGRIRLAPLTLALVRQNQVQKGDVLAAAQLAGIQAAKRTAELIPLCHPLTLDVVAVNLRLEKDGIRAQAEVRCTARTGAEMEALVAVVAALLTVYDMCKAVDKNMCLESIRLLGKEKRPLRGEGH